MKKYRIFSYMGVCALMVLSTACGNGSKNEQEATKNKFNPTERQSSMTDEARQEALAQKRALLSPDFSTLLYSHNVRFGIVEPRIQGDITQDVADRISMKMLQMAAQNGISGAGGMNFVLGAEIAQTGRVATGTAPQKMTTQYELTFKVLNTVTGDVYATAVQQVSGVGNSFAEATNNAVKEIKNTPAVQEMLQTASERIVAWYDENLPVIKNQVEEAEGQGNYALALAILNSIPEQSKVAYKYVAERQGSLLKGMLHKQAADMLGEMQALLASSGDTFNPAVGAYFSLIPTDSPEYKTAQTLYADYEKKCNARRADLEAKAERDEQAARELEKLKMLYDHEEELATIEADKIKSKYQSMAMAKAAAAKQQKSSGFFGAIGDAISGVASRVFKVADVAGAALTDKLGLEGYKEEVELEDL